MRNALVVFIKETTDSLRDRRSITAALIYSLMGPVLIGMVLNVLARREAGENALELAVTGAGNAPSLALYLEQHGARVSQAPTDPEAAIRSGKLDLALVIPEGFASDFQQARPAPVRLLHDSSKGSIRAPLDRARRLLAGYGREVAAARLLVRGVSPDVSSPLKVEEIDYATSRSRAALVLGMLPIFLLTAAFVGGMNVAIDVTAGERERGSLEPLLATAVTPGALVLGKWLATVVFALLGILVSLVFSLVVLRVVDHPALGARAGGWGIEPPDAIRMMAALVPLALFAAALQMLISTFSRSFKEAQTYLGLLLFLPMLPGFAIEFYSLQTQSWMAAIPLLGQQMALSDLMRGGAGGLFITHPWAHSWPAAAGTVLAAIACLYSTARLTRSERIVLGQ